MNVPFQWLICFIFLFFCLLQINELFLPCHLYHYRLFHSVVILSNSKCYSYIYWRFQVSNDRFGATQFNQFTQLSLFFLFLRLSFPLLFLSIVVKYLSKWQKKMLKSIFIRVIESYLSCSLVSLNLPDPSNRGWLNVYSDVIIILFIFNGYSLFYILYSYHSS